MATTQEHRPADGDQKIGRVPTHDEVDDKHHLESDGPVDYTGVAKKTDPEEIKLVRKLDYRIMV